MQSVLKISFVLAKKVAKGEVGGFQHRVAALAGYRTALVATGWMIFQHVCACVKKKVGNKLLRQVNWRDF